MVLTDPDGPVTGSGTVFYWHWPRLLHLAGVTKQDKPPKSDKPIFSNRPEDDSGESKVAVFHKKDPLGSPMAGISYQPEGDG